VARAGTRSTCQSSLAGRPRQALDAFRKLRATLVHALGVEPSARIQHLHRTILQAS
jgi:DNA-binding SARP family transcriptional activator